MPKGYDPREITASLGVWSSGNYTTPGNMVLGKLRHPWGYGPREITPPLGVWFLGNYSTAGGMVLGKLQHRWGYCPRAVPVGYGRLGPGLYQLGEQTTQPTPVEPWGPSTVQNQESMWWGKLVRGAIFGSDFRGAIWGGSGSDFRGAIFGERCWAEARLKIPRMT